MLFFYFSCSFFYIIRLVLGMRPVLFLSQELDISNIWGKSLKPFLASELPTNQPVKQILLMLGYTIGLLQFSHFSLCNSVN